MNFASIDISNFDNRRNLKGEKHIKVLHSKVFKHINIQYYKAKVFGDKIFLCNFSCFLSAVHGAPVTELFENFRNL